MAYKRIKMKDVLRCQEKQNNYDENDIESIFRYALKIKGKTFLTILEEAGLTAHEIEWIQTKETDKGLPGKIVEASYFGYELNSRQEADFEKVGVELKTTAADYDESSMRFKAGETVSVTQIDFRKPVEWDFYNSHLFNKLKMLIVIFYHRDKQLKSKLFYNVFYASLFRPSKEDLAIIRNDYWEINRKIEAGRADLLSRTDGIYLSTAPKARRSSNMINPYYGGVPIVKRSYTLRKNYVNVILNGYYSKNEERIITDLHELDRKSFAQIIQSRFENYIGWDIWEIADVLNHHAEQTRDIYGFNDIIIGKMTEATLATITARMLGLKRLNSEEFTKAGIVVKTIYFNVRGINKEQFRLGDANFEEIYTTPIYYNGVGIDEQDNEYEVIYSGWEDSELYSKLEGLRYLFVVFQEDEDGDIIFEGSKLWAMSDTDIELAKEDWIDIKRVLENGVQLVVGRDGRTYNNFPGVAHARRIHLRPHGDKAFYVDCNGHSWGNGKISDTDLLPDGRRMTRQSYWLSSRFVRNIVCDLLY